MEDLFRSYWWLLLIFGAFLVGAWEQWLQYQRSRNTLDLIKTFTAQGKDVPAELLREVREAPIDDDDRYMSRRERRRYRGYYRSGWRSPYGYWRRAIVIGSVAGAMWYAIDQHYVTNGEGGLRIVALVLTCIALATALLAIFGTLFRRGDPEK